MSTLTLRSCLAGTSCVAVLCIASSAAWAQKAAPPTAPPPAPPVAAPKLPPPPPPPPPPTSPDKKLEYSLWGRFGATLQSPFDTTNLNKLTANGEVDLFVHGQINKVFGIDGSFQGVFGPVLTATGAPSGAITSAVALEDATFRIDAMEEFHVWLGRMLVASDRSNFSGPWFISPWLYPGTFSATYLVPQGALPPIGPRQGPLGRNDGFTLWGQFMGGMFKYYAGVYNLQEAGAGATPLYSARVSLALWNPEPGYFNASTYYGHKDIIGIGIGAQFQPTGSTLNPATPSDYSEINADVLVEKNLGLSGVVTFEGAVYKFMGDAELINYSYFLLASYLTADKIGPGKLQPLVRLQQAKPNNIGGVQRDTGTLFDIQVGYPVEDFALRFAIGYENSNLFGVKGNAIFFGSQWQR
jgi:hypothetical protein